jgi:transcriptional regulator with PAS, ATPase and Fis domain
LRERREDIIPLTRHLLALLAQEASLSGLVLDPEAAEAFIKYDWPGNVRELINVLERILSSLESHIIRLPDIPFYLFQEGRTSKSAERASLKKVQSRTERDMILHALKTTNYNKSRAANLLGIHRTLLYKKMKKYALPNKKEEVKG